ncbi:MAG: pentapeptide repeat protein [Desertimonas sp.]|nr:pentapeptide repeat protein [Desertimonas sp.]
MTLAVDAPASGDVPDLRRSPREYGEPMPWPPADTEFRGAQFVDRDMTGARFREVALTGAQFRGVELVDAEIDGYVRNLVVNGVDVMPLVTAELDRLHPERVLLRSDDPEELRRGWAELETMWAATTARISALPDELRHRSIDDEYSAVETLRHLIFDTDAWLGRAILGAAAPWHPWGLAAAGMDDQAAMGLDPDANPSFEDVRAVRDERQRMVRDFLATATPKTLQAPGVQVAGPGWPPPDPQRTSLEAIHVILDEEWAHRRFAERDLDAMDNSAGPPEG